MRVSLLKKILVWAFVSIILVAVYLPIVVLILSSFFKTKAAPGSFSLSAFATLFRDNQLLTAVLNTFILTVAASLIAAVLGTFTAIGMFNMKKIGRQAISAANQIPVVNADIVTAVGFALLIVAVKDTVLSFVQGWPILIIAHVMITMPYVVLTILPRLRQLNPNVYEAALDLGAKPWVATIKVLLPQLLGASIAGFALAFTLSLDDFVVAYFNNGQGSINTISTLLYTRLVKQNPMDSFNALSSILFVVILAALFAVNIAAARRREKERKTVKAK